MKDFGNNPREDCVDSLMKLPEAKASGERYSHNELDLIFYQRIASLSEFSQRLIRKDVSSLRSRFISSVLLG